jgi:hypothetical protein
MDNELQSLTAQERLLLVHAAYGRSMLAAHRLELTLGTLLVCQTTLEIEPGTKRRSEIDRIGRLTLGQLIKLFISKFSPNEDLQQELSNTLFFRNELVHRISETILNATRSIEWEEVVITEMNAIIGYFADSSKLLEPYITEWKLKVGLTDELFAELVSAAYPGAKIGD